MKRENTPSRVTKFKVTPSTVYTALQQTKSGARQFVTKKMDRREVEGLVPTQLMIEYCKFERAQNGPTKMGALISRTYRFVKVRTFHAPLSGIHGTSFSNFCETIIQACKDDFRKVHSTLRPHNAQGVGIIMELYCRIPSNAGPERLVTESNWRHVLERINIAHPQTMRQVGREVYLPYFVARFTRAVTR